MKEQADPLWLEELRERADARLSHRGAFLPRPTADIEHLIEELEVHKVELEMQNSELRRAQSDLTEARDRYRALYDLAPIAYLTVDEGGRILEVNRSAVHLLGVAARELVGRPLSTFMDEGEADLLHFHLRHAFEKRSRTGVDLMLGRSGDGDESPTRRPIHVESVVSGGNDARPECYCALIDLSDQQEAEERRRTWEARAKTVLDTAVDAIVSSDATGRIEAVNKAAERLFGYSEQEVLGKNVRVLMPDPDRRQHDDYMRRYRDTGEARIIGRANRDVVGLRKDGSMFPLELGIGEWWDHGERKFTAIIHDITERKRAESELRESEARFRQIAEHVDDVFLLFDRLDRRVIYVNPAFETIWGRPSSELYDSNTRWIRWVAPEDRERVVLAYKNMLKGDPFDEEFCVLRPNGDVRLVRGRNFPIADESGSVHRDVGVIQDITNERALEAELRQAQKMEAIGALASGVAHDFNNVLQAILGCINIARSDGAQRGNADPYLERAASAAQRGGELANQLMAFSRKRKSDSRPLAVDELLKGLGKLIGRLVTEQITVRMNLAAPGAMILADPVQLERILMNLAANARDAMPEGGVLAIRTDLLAPGSSKKGLGLDPAVQHLRIVVQDSGVGMDARTQSRMFEPFFTTKDIGQGTGLGLATVFAVVKELGGSIRVDSGVGEGTTFTLYFPRLHQSTEEDHQRASDTETFSGTALLVEDDPLVRMTLREYLADLGLEVLEAEGVEQARTLGQVSEGALQVLVTDVVMPVMRGPQLAQLVRKNHPGVPVLLMSANPDFLRDDERRLENALILRKPFTKQDLARSLRALLGREKMVARPEKDASLDDVDRPRPSPATAGSRTILLVEDEPMARMALGEMLQMHGYHVKTAETPSRALELTTNPGAPIDLLLTDVRLPEMRGEDLAEQLRRSYPELRVVFMSGSSEIPAGGSAFLLKPIDFDKLLATVEQVLSP